jgi:serine/threonine protein kinase/tetratricopeptide (TPR) repeat protein
MNAPESSPSGVSESAPPLIDQIAEEFVERFRRGERPPVSEYEARYPEQAEAIRELFPTLVMMEQLKPPSTPLPPASQAECASEVASLGKLGDYQIVREIGRGGMGIVYEAVQESLGRKVALKVLPKQLLGDASRQARFEREARAAARLHHSNIVPVFGVGRENGLHYYAMQYINGLGLDEVLRELKKLRSPSQTLASAERSPAAEHSPAASAASYHPSLSVTVTRSLLTGQFESAGDVQVGDDRTAAPATHRQSGPGKDAATPAAANLGRSPSDTAKARLSDTVHSSATFSLIGRKDTGPGTGRTTYWQSVARIGAQVGEALHHAHEQGVLHRDIKPSNLLLDTRGTVWVTDFGLAKADDQRDLTQTGDVLGTLRYMAPEMFSGQADRRCDVYSLGLTLYELLALRPAFDEGDRGRLIRLVLHEAPLRLRTLDPSIPRDVETIIHKAIDREPAHRYATAQELADDLNRFLSDEPIHARRVSPLTRVSRWCKRNPAIAGLTSTVALLLVAATIASTMAATHFQSLVMERGTALTAANKAKADAQKEKAEADRARNRATQAAQQERDLRQEAERQRDRANTNYARARRAVDAYLSRVTEEELLSVPGLQPLRKELLAEALKFYSEFTREQSDDPELQIEIAMAQFRLGVIQRELGDIVADRASNGEAIKQLESLRDRQLGGIEIQSVLVEAYRSAGRYDDAMALAEKVLATNPESVAVRSALAETYNQVAVSEKNRSDVATELSYHQKALEIRRKLVEQQPQSAEFNAELASTLNNIGVLLGDQKKTQDALAMYELSLSYNDKACELAPHSILWGRWDATGHKNAGVNYRTLGQDAEALGHFKKMVEVRRRLVFQNPAVSDLRSELYQDWLVLADHQKRMSLTVDAARSYRDAAQVLEQMPHDTPGELFQLAVVYAVLAAPPEVAAAAQPQDPQDAAADERQRYAELALQSLTQAVNQGWADPAALKNYKAFDSLRERAEFQKAVQSVETLAEAQRLFSAKAKSEQEQLDNQRKAAEMLGPLAADSPHQARHQRGLALVLHSMGVVQIGLKQFDEAEKSLAQAVDLRAKRREAKPDDPQWTLDWLISRVAQGQLRWQQGKFSEAHHLWQQCLSDMSTLDRARQDNAQVQQVLADLEGRIVNYYGQAGLMPLVQQYLIRNLDRQRVKGIWRGANTPSDGELSAALLLLQDPAPARRYFEVLHTQAGSFSDGLWFEHAMLLRGLGLVDNQKLDVGPSVRKVEEFLKDNLKNGWGQVSLAVTEFHAGKFEDASRRMVPFRDNVWGQEAYLNVAILWKLGDKERALQRWKGAEGQHLRHMQAVLGRSPLDSPNGITREHWWQFAYSLVMRRLAAETIADGQPVPVDPWLHLIQARGYSLIGETQLAAAELSAATAATPNNPQVWLAAARLQNEHGPLAAQAAASWRKAIELSGDDPLPLIDRGRQYAQRGQHESADADYAQAAALSPNELNKFFDAGWWVVGPYPAALREFGPPELDADPSIPVHTVDPQAGLSDQPLPWRSYSPGPTGWVDLSNVAGWQENTSYYALAHVFSPDDTTAMLVVSHDRPLRLWVNGQLVEEHTPVTPPMQPWYAKRRIPIALRPGRNQLLVKVNSRSFLVRAATSALDQSLFLSEQDRFRAAGEALAPHIESALDELRREISHQNIATMFPLALLEDQSAYERVCGELLQQFKSTTDGGTRAWIVWAVTLRPNEAFDAHAAECIQAAEAFVPERPGYGDFPLIAALANYRAGRYAEAARWADQASSTGWQPPLRALIAHKLLESAASEKWLEQSRHALAAQLHQVQQQVVAPVPQPSMGSPLWYWRVALEALLLEAEQTIAPEQPGSGARILAMERELGNWWENCAATLAFDRAVFTTTVGESHKVDFPQPFLARGKRMAELGRFDEAEADFNKAVELAPEDSHVLAARAVFFADYGQSARGAADFEAALKPMQERYRAGVPIDVAVAARSDLDPVLAAFHTDDGLQRLARILTTHEIRHQHIPKMDWTASEQAYIPACLALLNNDLAEFERLRNSRPRTQSPYFATILLGLAPTTEPLTSELLTSAEQMRRTKDDEWGRRFDGVALLRAGRYEEAIKRFEGALGSAKDWQADGVVYPLLALAHHHRGHQDIARRWLAKSRLWLGWHMRISAEDAASMRGANRVLPRDWLLLALVYWRESLTLIEGPEVADAELARLTTEPVEIAALRPDVDQRIAESFNRAIAATPDNPLLWIKRGRWFAERGQLEKSDADYAKAAALTPGELNKFLETGWWVIGPYPPELSEFCPPEVDADPAQPVFTVDPQKGLSDKPSHWTRVPTGDFGRLELANYPGGQGNASCYAMSHVYSLREATATLCISANKEARIWVNGELVQQFKPGGTGDWSRNPRRIPVVLRRGRNTIVVKGYSDSLLTLRLGDHPFDRGMELARYGQWKEAADSLEVGLRRSSEAYMHEYPFRCLAAFRLAAGDVEAVRNLYSELFADHHATAWLGWKWALAQIGSSAAGVTDDHQTLVKLAESLRGNPNLQFRRVIPLAYARAGRWQDVVDYFASDEEMRTTMADTFPLLALAYQKLGNAAESRIQLAKIVTNDDAMAQWSSSGPMENVFMSLLMPREAAIAVTGSGESIERKFEEHYERRRADRDRFPPETFDFDTALQIYPDQPHLYVARGRRLVELGKMDEAHSDFQKAVELAPKDRDVLVARARFHRQNRNAEMAAADLDAAFKLSREQQLPTYPWCNSLDLEFLQDTEVAQRLGVLQADRPSRISAHLFVRGWNGDTANAHADLVKLRSLGRYEDAACSALLIGDRDAYEEICSEVKKAKLETHAQLWPLLLGEPKCAKAEDLLEPARDLVVKAGGNARARQFLGWAQFRAGQWKEAAATLLAATDRSDSWQHDVPVWPILAMAHHQLGNAPEAKKWFERCNWYEDLHRRNGLQPQAFGSHNVQLGEYATFVLLLREARARIERAPMTTAPQ